MQNKEAPREAAELIVRLDEAGRAIEAHKLRALCQFADRYSELPEQDDGFALPGAQRLVRVGSEGTPEIAEFASLELAALQNISEGSAEMKIGDALDLRHRFPKLWDLVMDLEVEAWVAKRAVKESRRLPYENTRALDEELAEALLGLSLSRQIKLIKALILKHTPIDQTETAHERAMNSRGVWVGRDTEFGTRGIGVRLDAADALRLDQQLSRLASILKKGGCEEEEQVRRAMALGILATPARALQMLQGNLLGELPADPSAFKACFAEAQPGHTCGRITVDPIKLLPKTEVVVHLTDATLQSGSGMARVEKLGPMLAGWLKDLTANTHIAVKPVLDANNQVPSDSYECPPNMRRAIQLRNTHCVFPGSGTSSSHLDIDHTKPFQHGRIPGAAPPRTTLENLAPLARKAHRAKTHGGWRVKQPLPGIYLWQSPLGYQYLVTPSGSWRLDKPAMTDQRRELVAA